MNPLPNTIAATASLAITAAITTLATLAFADGRITVGIIHTTLATVCAIAGIANLNIATRLRLLNELAADAEERTAQAHATYANAARIAEDEITISDLADAMTRWATVAETEQMAGAPLYEAFATALALTLTHDRKNR